MAQQQQQIIMYQQAMQQQNMTNLQLMGAHSAPTYAMASQNEWANFRAGNPANFYAQYATQSQQQNRFYGMRRNDTAVLHGHPSIPRSGIATPVTSTGIACYDPDPSSSKRFTPMGSSMMQYIAENAIPQQHPNAKGNGPTSEADDMLSNEDAAAILALVKQENGRSASAAIAYDETMTAKPQAMESGQQDTPTPAAYRSYY